jgi:oligosaccharide reducing-end xylanase
MASSRRGRFSPGVVALVAALGWFGVSAVAQGAQAGGPGRNLFHEHLGATEAEIDAKLASVWEHYVRGDDATERLVYPSGGDAAYVLDVGNDDVRSEGMSYGMMIAVQLGHRAEFDRLWTWVKRHMYHAEGPRRGYFAWQCARDGRHIDPGSASDGEVWFATVLFLASHRWGDGDGIFDYGAEAQALLREMRRGDRGGGITAIFDPTHRQVVFAPTTEAAQLTDPSYHVPAFTGHWARWDADSDGREFWAAVTSESRAFLRRAAHPSTGLMPEYAHFDGSPFTATTFGPGKGDFRFDAWRTLSNVALDHAMWAADPWQIEQSNRVLRFLGRFGAAPPNQFTLDGRPLSEDVSPGLVAMAAVAGLAADKELARPFVQALWDMAPPSGRWRYYDGLLYFLGLLQASGRFALHGPDVGSR